MRDNSAIRVIDAQLTAKEDGILIRPATGGDCGLCAEIDDLGASFNGFASSQDQIVAGILVESHAILEIATIGLRKVKSQRINNSAFTHNLAVICQSCPCNTRNCNRSIINKSNWAINLVGIDEGSRQLDVYCATEAICNRYISAWLNLNSTRCGRANASAIYKCVVLGQINVLDESARLLLRWEDADSAPARCAQGGVLHYKAIYATDTERVVLGSREIAVLNQHTLYVIQAYTANCGDAIGAAVKDQIT